MSKHFTSFLTFTILFIISICLVGIIVDAQGTGNVRTLRVKTDANGYLLVAGGTQTNPVTTTNLNNARLRVDSSGNLIVVIAGGTTSSPILEANGTNTAPSYAFSSSPNTGVYYTTNQFNWSIGGTNLMAFNGNLSLLNTNPKLTFGTTADTILTRDNAANILAMVNGTNPQTLRLYNTFTDASNYERMLLGTSGANNFVIGTENAGTGTARGFVLETGNTGRWIVNSVGHFLANTDNTYDIGASGANRVRTIYAGTDIIAGNSMTAGFALSLTATAFVSLGTPANGTLKFCSDCLKGSNPCSGSSTGTFAHRQNGAWVCF